MRWHSGWLAVTAAAMLWSTMVLPALGGATIRPRWPLPTGAIRSITRPAMAAGPLSPGSPAAAARAGCSGVSSAKCGRRRGAAAGR